MINRKIIFTVSGLLVCLFIGVASNKKVAKQTTHISISIPESPLAIDLMIYGQMLEDCNDKVIYGGLLNENNEENPVVSDFLKELQMPVVRWPAGTYIHEYDWENGIGPKEERPVVSCIRWGGHDTNLFGTDEFLQWCKKIGTVPYINFNMSNHPQYAASLGDALNWIEYVNGSQETAFGMKRASNGHPEPYDVKYWCIGNENYGSYGIHKAETADFYSTKLHQWAATIKTLYPDLQLLGVGHVYDWNKTILDKNGHLIDFLTIHFYMGAKVKDGNIQEPVHTLFSPARAEVQLRKNIELLENANKRNNQKGNPIRFSIDEWNCRHSVFNGEKYAFTRNDDRRQFDVVTTAGMLNVFIRQSPHVGMANYIFPVNGHGLIRTVGGEDAYKSTIYHVFELYRKYMIGQRLDIKIEGSKAKISLNELDIEGNFDKDLTSGEAELEYIDGAAVINEDGAIHVALINRSHTESHKVKLNLPEGYTAAGMWRIESSDINDANTESDRNNIVPQRVELSKKQKNTTITIPPCGFTLIQYKM